LGLDKAISMGMRIRRLLRECVI